MQVKYVITLYQVNAEKFRGDLPLWISMFDKDEVDIIKNQLQ